MAPKKKPDAPDAPETGLVTTGAAQVPADVSAAMEEKSGKGLEGTDQTCYAIPFLRILQGLSPQCTEGNAEFIEDAKPGMLFNTVSKELFDGKVGVLVVPAGFKKSLIQWASRDDGGGFRGEHPAESDILTKTTKNDKGQDELEAGDIIVDTRSHYCLMAHPTSGALLPVVVAMSSTQVKKSKGWLTNMRSLTVEGKNGAFNPPTYGQVYRLTTVPESNSKGSWHGWKIATEGLCGMDALSQGEAFNTEVLADAVRPAHESLEGSATEETVPF